MIEDFLRPPDGGAVLAALLERSGVDYRREGDRFRFLFTSGGCKWQMACQGQTGRVLAYGIHPAVVTDPAGAALLCAEWNGRLVEGSLFLQENRFVFRTGCALIEAIDASERVARMLEYNAAVMVSYWERMAAGAEGTPIHF